MFHFLHNYQVEKGSDFTHTSIVKPSGSFYIPGDKLDEFFNIYGLAMQAKVDLYLTEKPRDIIPVLIDIDFRFPKDDKLTYLTRSYTYDHILDILKIYIKHVNNTVNTPEKFNIYVMEKSAPVLYKDRIKDGIHILIPEIVTRPSVQLYIRTQVINEIMNEGLFDKLGVENSLDDIFDEAVITTNNWQMYGSKKPECEAYKITHIFDNELNKIDILDDHTEYVSVLSLRNKYIETTTKIECINYIKNIQDEIFKKKKAKMLKNTSVFQSSQNIKKNTTEDVDSVSKFINILSPVRANNYSQWIRLGWCLRNIDYRLLDQWIEFSKKSTKFIEGECERIWNYMKDDGLGFGTLHMWAKEDNPEAYTELLRNDINRIIDNASNETHTDVAAVVYALYKYDFVCISIKNNAWFEFKNHRWNYCDSAYTLRTYISNVVTKEFARRAAYWSTRGSTTDDNDEQTRFADKSKKLSNLVMKLKNVSFKSNILKECCDMFYQNKFEEKLDSRCNLIGFENGIYDLDALEFREGRPEDYVMFSTNINYVPYDAELTASKEINDILSKIFTNQNLREYILCLFASFLNGNVRQERFHVWTGSGSNGKSVIIELFEKSFGDYCCKLPITLLTQKRAAANAATSELARTKGKRFACLQEPSEDEKLNVGLMKELSGGDKIQARLLFKDPIEFKPQFKMILACNHLPTVPSDDGGTWRRIRVAEFTSKFCEKPDPNISTEFLMDITLKEKFDNWKEMFMSLLINKYITVVSKTGVYEPDEVLECTREYQRSNDLYADFINNELDKNDMSCIQYNEVRDMFKIYLKDNNVLPSQATIYLRKTGFTARMEKFLGKLVKIPNSGEGWKGYRLKPANVLINEIVNDDPDPLM